MHKKNNSKNSSAVLIATVDLTGNEIADRIMKIAKPSEQNNLETVKNDHDKEIPKERYIYISRRKKKIIDDLRLI